ncbi:daf-36 [Symbiodinium necroappetens]|uniref:Daf-36 protein n=1 Tax=Symbiodinium necroappetens TaxID=1628268 RepID=A0A812NYK2_9DINO|nr:daf-36 [Symbiodinium necroappetens]
MDKEHMCSFEERTHGLQLFGSPRLPVPLSRSVASSIQTNVTFEGPTVVHFRLQTPLGVLRQVKTILPVEPFKQYVEARWYAERSVPRAVAVALGIIGGRALEQDREVWENKIYHKKPVLMSGDGPFLDFMRWYGQFYSTSSRNFGYDW